MDEPFSALDNEMKEAPCLEISGLVAEQSTRFVIVTHDLTDAVFLGNHILAITSSGDTIEYQIASPPIHARWISAIRANSWRTSNVSGICLPKERMARARTTLGRNRSRSTKRAKLVPSKR